MDFLQMWYIPSIYMYGNAWNSFFEEALYQGFGFPRIYPAFKTLFNVLK